MVDEKICRRCGQAPFNFDHVCDEELVAERKLERQLEAEERAYERQTSALIDNGSLHEGW